MTGLYECLVQIRALRDTAQRLAGLVPSGPADTAAAAVLRHRVHLELAHGEWLRMLVGERTVPTVQPIALDPPGGAVAALEHFLAARTTNLALLDRLGAADLERPGTLPGGRPATATDVVAMMVAADTDAADALRRTVQSPTDDPQGGP